MVNYIIFEFSRKTNHINFFLKRSSKNNETNLFRCSASTFFGNRPSRLAFSNVQLHRYFEIKFQSLKDLKPENLLLQTNDEKNLIIKLTDFGFAKEALKGLKTPK